MIALRAFDLCFEVEIARIRGKLDHLITTRMEYALDNFTLPFTEEIQEKALLANFKMSTILLYEGKTDPLEYVSIFNDDMNLTVMIGLARCKCFLVTLAKTAKN